jgi:hypothetical protein
VPPAVWQIQLELQVRARLRHRRQQQQQQQDSDDRQPMLTEQDWSTPAASTAAVSGGPYVDRQQQQRRQHRQESRQPQPQQQQWQGFPQRAAGRADPLVVVSGVLRRWRRTSLVVSE